MYSTYYYNLISLGISQVLNPHVRQDNLSGDFCDGTAYKKHSLFPVDQTAFQINLYYDELEIVNPLGGKIGKHKLGKVCYKLLLILILITVNVFFNCNCLLVKNM